MIARDYSHLIDSGPSRPVDADLSTLERLIAAEHEHLLARVKVLGEDIAAFLARHANPGGWDSDLAGTPATVDELVARLHGTGSFAYKVARHLRTLVDLSEAFVAGTVDCGHRPGL